MVEQLLVQTLMERCGPSLEALHTDEGSCGSDMKSQASRRNHTWLQGRLCCFIGTSREGRHLSRNGDMIRSEAFLAEGTPQRARRMHERERGQLGAASRYRRGQTTSRVSNNCLVRNPPFILSAAEGWEGVGVWKQNDALRSLAGM